MIGKINRQHIFIVCIISLGTAHNIQAAAQRHNKKNGNIIAKQPGDKVKGKLTHSSTPPIAIRLSPEQRYLMKEKEAYKKEQTKLRHVGDSKKNNCTKRVAETMFCFFPMDDEKRD